MPPISQRTAHREPPRPTLFQIQRAFERSAGRSEFVIDGDRHEIALINRGDHWASYEDVF